MNRIKMIRELLNITQQQMADALGMNQSNYSNKEKYNLLKVTEFMDCITEFRKSLKYDNVTEAIIVEMINEIFEIKTIEVLTNNRENKTADKVYLGDGAYAEFDGYNVIVTTSDGIITSNKIFLEPEVSSALFKYILKHHKPKGL